MTITAEGENVSIITAITLGITIAGFAGGIITAVAKLATKTGRLMEQLESNEKRDTEERAKVEANFKELYGRVNQTECDIKAHSMQIIHDFLTINEYSRPGRKLKEVLGVVLHWTANPSANAKENRDYFENKKTGCGGYASAHYIIDQNGLIVAAVPEYEVAYHTGSSQRDPASGEIYTDEARRRFGKYASENNSPNNCTIGVELCPIDSAGNFSDATIGAAIELCADILTRYNLPVTALTTHHNVVGWKDCPKLWTEKPALFEAFCYSVAEKKQRG